MVKEGDEVKQFQPLVEVLTDKANVEIPSPISGRVVRFLASEGERVSVGSPIIEIEVEDTSPSPEVKTEREEIARGPQPASAVSTETMIREEKKGRKIVKAPPSVRKLARELGIDLSLVEGTGPGGVITRDDVLRYAEKAKERKREVVKPTAVQKPGVEGAEKAVELKPPLEKPIERIPLKGIRKIMAERMVQAKSTIPHAYIVEEVDVTDLLATRDHLAKIAEEKGVRLTLLPFIVKAVVKALKEFPLLNASFDSNSNEIIIKKYYNIGIAVDTELGLVVPNIKDADKKGLFQIAKEISNLAKKAREGKLSLDEVRDGTFTITNIGSIGTVVGMPVINPPEVAILGVHRVVVKPTYIDGEIKPRKIVNISLSFDHRVIEGAYAARFLNSVKRYLEDPILLIASDREFDVS